MTSFESESFETVIQKVRLLGKGKEFMKKSDKKQQRVEGVPPEADFTFLNFFYAHFLFN